MISAGCSIEGTVINSVLSPGVKVAENAVVKDSILSDDCIIREGATIDLAILDKRVTVEPGAVVGIGEDKDTPNSQYPKHLYTGISLIGKGAVIPGKTTLGRNCIVHPWKKAADFPGQHIKTGETV